jgi:hypothetical protein
MNLVGVSTLKTAYDFTVPGQVTITFSNSTGLTVYGTIVVEAGKHRSLTEALNTIAEAFTAANDPNLAKHRLILDVNNHVATTVFS